VRRVSESVRSTRFAGLGAALAFAFAPLAASAVPLPGQAAPDFSLPAPDHKAVKLAALRGHAVYVNFFASWCGPCNVEAPSILQLREKYASAGLEIVGIDELDAPGQGEAFQKKYHDPFGLVAIDDSGNVGRTYGAIGLPVHIFINRHGIVTTYRQGEMDPGQIEAAIKDALK